MALGAAILALEPHQPPNLARTERRAIDVFVVACMATSFAVGVSVAYGPRSSLSRSRLYTG